MSSASYRTIGRLTHYWRALRDLEAEGQTHAYSHLLAAKARVTAAQVRRDIMVLGYSGTPARGYEVRKLIECIEAYVFPASEQRAAIAGVGNIGLALLKFFTGRRPNLRIAASFEANPEKFDRLIYGCRCHSIDSAREVILQEGISVGIIAVPDAEAQYVADLFVAAGIRGILNFARTPLRVPVGVYVENMDLAMSLDRVAYFARRSLKTEDAALTAKAPSAKKESNS